MGISPIGSQNIQAFKKLLAQDTSYNVLKRYKNLELRETTFFKYLADSNSHVKGIKFGGEFGFPILRAGTINGQAYTSVVAPNKNSTTFRLDDAFAEKLYPTEHKGTVRNLHLEGEKKDGKITKLTSCVFNEREGDKISENGTALDAIDLKSILESAKRNGVQMHNLTKAYINKAIEFLQK